jgi:hypothetical protein
MIKVYFRAPAREESYDARIIQVFAPFTLSCVVVVEMDCPFFKLKGNIVLKLFDRRFATQLREDENVQPWTMKIERDYHQFVLDGGASSFITELNNSSDISEQEGTWNTSQDEAYLHDHLFDLYETEIEVYNILKDMQGSDIPQLFASIMVPGFGSTATDPIRQYIGVPGILLQYIDGFPLTNLANHAPREHWQDICEDAIRIVSLIGDRGILNEDVKSRSFVVSQAKGNTFKVVMIDFALCSFRRDYDDEEDWSVSKAAQDEEGAIGLIMQARLNGGFVYCRSDRYKRPLHLTNYECSDGGPGRNQN